MNNCTIVLFLERGCKQQWSRKSSRDIVPLKTTVATGEPWPNNGILSYHFSWSTRFKIIKIKIWRVGENVIFQNLPTAPLLKHIPQSRATETLKRLNPAKLNTITLHNNSDSEILDWKPSFIVWSYRNVYFYQ
jgi:hypothetical protein